MIDVKRPRLLDNTLHETAVLYPLGLQLNLQTPGVSTAAMTLAPGDGPPAMHAWVALYNANGFVGYYRVTSPATDYTQQAVITLRHGIDCLADAVLAAQEDYNGTPAALLTRIMNAQTTLVNGVKPWTLGDCAATDNIKIQLNYPRLNDLLADIEEKLEGYIIEYDQTVFPWVMHVHAKPATVDSEFRLNRNIMTISRTLNDNDLCTQLILSINSKVTSGSGSRTVTTTNTYIKTYDNAAAQAVWGIVQKTADIDTGDNLTVTTDAPVPSTPEADAWAAQFLADHAQPTVQIQISAQELKQITGDTWDEAKLGHMCRVAMPDYGETFTERVVNVTYPDALGQPDTVNVSLANQLPRFSSSIAMLRKETAGLARSGRSAGRAAADAQELEVWSQIVKYQEDALDGTGIIQLYESGIDMDAQGGVRIFSLAQGFQSNYAGIQVNNQAITSEVTRATAEEGTLSSRITQNASDITLKVSKGDVATQLSVECGNVHITGSAGSANLQVDGYVLAADLATDIADISLLNVQDLNTVGDASVGGDLTVYGDLSVALANTLTCGDVACGNLDCDGISFGGGTTYTKVVTSWNISGNTLTLYSSDGTSENFSKAGSINVILKNSQTWKPAYFTHGGWDVSVTASGTNVASYTDTVTVDGASAWAAGWAEGYDDGVAEFTHATVTPQGAAETVYYSDPTNGTTYYTRGSSFTVQGESTNVRTCGTVHYYVRHASSETPTSAWYTRQSTQPASGTTYNTEYQASSATYYAAGTTTRYAVGGTSIKVSSGTRYAAGTPDSTTYYTKNST